MKTTNSMSAYKVLIIEDEPPAVNRLSKLLKSVDANIEIVDVIDSVETAISYLKHKSGLDLIFMDIQLSDGLSFDIFNETEVKVPIIFTTAFDQYTLSAFKVHSIDYLLKPIEPEELSAAIDKFKEYFSNEASVDNNDLHKLVKDLMPKKYKERFLVKTRKELKYVAIDQIAYFYSEDGYTHLVTHTGQKQIIDYKLDELEAMVDPDKYFRINRKMIVELHSILKIETYFNSRLKLKLNPPHPSDVIVSRERCTKFKFWLDN